MTASARKLAARDVFDRGRHREGELDTRPASRSVKTGPAPLYGTWTVSMLATLLSSTQPRWAVVPTPDDAQLIAPGFSRASLDQVGQRLNRQRRMATRMTNGRMRFR